MQISRLVFTHLTGPGSEWDNDWNIKNYQNLETYPIVWVS
jgi:hypothetical protein